MRHTKANIKEDNAFREWVRTLPSIISGGSEDDDGFEVYINGEGISEAAHVNRVPESGVGIKALFSCVPLKPSEHRLYHKKGEEYFHPKEWWTDQRNKIREQWFRAIRFHKGFV